jgi:O-acetyl-ADP-ribose deacetylase (regulator of RNase III)
MTGIINPNKTRTMVTYTQGNILEDRAEAVVNTVNCVGIMGRGVALQFRNAYPENFSAYLKACHANEVQPGKLFIFETGLLSNPKYIINFPTKRHWRGKSRMEDIISGLQSLVRAIKQKNIRSIALPPLGCGLGGLDWGEVRQYIEDILSEISDTQVTIYEPKGAPVAEKMVRNREVSAMTSGRAALVELVRRYLDGLLDPFITLLEVHKLMYFMQEAGEPLRLYFIKHHYGPYAQNLSHVLKRIEGHLISGYADGGDTPDKQLQLVPGAVKDAQQFLTNKPETLERFQKVSRLVEGFESPFGMELLATVHWVTKHESHKGKADLVRHVHAWNSRKRQFTPRQIELASNALAKWANQV